MSKCREEFDVSSFANKDPRFLQVWQAAWNARGKVDAEICATYASDKWSLYKGRPPYTGAEDGRANMFVQGQSDGADDCAEAIEKEQEK